MDAFDYSKLFMALALAIPPEFPQIREQATREALRLSAWQKEACRKELIEIDEQIEALQKRRAEIEADLAILEERLKAHPDVLESRRMSAKAFVSLLSKTI